MGRKACELEGWKNVNTINLLALAYAESGDFEQAVKYQTQALGMLGPSEDKTDLEELLELYRDRKRYHQKSRKSTRHHSVKPA